MARQRRIVAKDVLEGVKPGLRGVAIRGLLAEARFLEYAEEHAGLSRAEAEKALAVYRKEKIIRIDRITGQFTFKHGAFGDAAVLRRAAGRR